MATEYRMSNPSWGKEAILTRTQMTYASPELKNAVLSSVRFLTVEGMERRGKPCEYIWAQQMGLGTVVSKSPLHSSSFEQQLSQVIAIVCMILKDTHDAQEVRGLVANERHNVREALRRRTIKVLLTEKRQWHFQKELYNESRTPFVNETRELTNQEARVLFTQEIKQAIDDGYVVRYIEQSPYYPTTDEFLFINLVKQNEPDLLIWLSNCLEVRL